MAIRMALFTYKSILLFSIIFVISFNALLTRITVKASFTIDYALKTLQHFLRFSINTVVSVYTLAFALITFSIEITAGFAIVKVSSVASRAIRVALFTYESILLFFRIIFVISVIALTCTFISLSILDFAFASSLDYHCIRILARSAVVLVWSSTALAIRVA